jgi:hypothetical protein
VFVGGLLFLLWDGAWLTGLDLYRPYRDHTFFQYEVEMTREAGDQEERYVLSVSGIWSIVLGWVVIPSCPFSGFPEN